MQSSVSAPLHRPPSGVTRTRVALGLVVVLIAACFAALAPSSAHAADQLLSQGRPATASSTENGTFPASAAVDGNTGSRWSSAFADPQWIRVDLGSVQQLSRVSLDWEAAYATAFQIQTSTDANTWSTVLLVLERVGVRHPAEPHGTSICRATASLPRMEVHRWEESAATPVPCVAVLNVRLTA